MKELGHEVKLNLQSQQNLPEGWKIQTGSNKDGCGAKNVFLIKSLFFRIGNKHVFEVLKC